MVASTPNDSTSTTTDKTTAPAATNPELSLVGQTAGSTARPAASSTAEAQTGTLDLSTPITASYTSWNSGTPAEAPAAPAAPAAATASDSAAAAPATPGTATDSATAAKATASPASAGADSTPAATSGAQPAAQSDSASSASKPGCEPPYPFEPQQPNAAAKEVLSQDGQLNQEVNQDIGQLGGNYGNLEKSVNSIQQQAEKDSDQCGGMTAQEQQQLNQKETGVLNQMNSDYSAAAKPGSFAAEHPRQAQIFNEAGTLNMQANMDKGHLDGQYGNIEKQIKGVESQDKADAKQNGGYITIEQQQQLNKEEDGIESQLNKDYSNGAKPGSFAAEHPRRAQVLSGDKDLENEINKDKGDLSGQYQNLMDKAQSIQTEEQHDAKANGGFITVPQEDRMLQQEKELQQAITSDYKPDQDSVQAGESIWGDPHLKASDGSTVGDQIAAGQDVLLLQTKNGVSITGKTSSFNTTNSDGVPVTVFTEQQVNLGNGQSVLFDAKTGQAYEVGPDGCKTALSNGQKIASSSDPNDYVTYESASGSNPATLNYNFAGCGDGSIAGKMTANTDSNNINYLNLDVSSSSGSDFGGMLPAMDTSYNGVTANAQTEKTGDGYFTRGRNNESFYVNSLGA